MYTCAFLLSIDLHDIEVQYAFTGAPLGYESVATDLAARMVCETYAFLKLPEIEPETSWAFLGKLFWLQTPIWT